MPHLPADTLRYYDTHACEFAQGTKDSDMSELYEIFEQYIKPGGHVLDLGCGSGRDSLHFKEQGFEVTVVDGSRKLCKLASEYIGQPVLCMRFEEVDWKARFDGIWACASLLHVKKDELPVLLPRLSAALKPDGIFYASFKYGDSERVKEGRFFNDYTESDIGQLFAPECGLHLLEYRLTRDVRADRGMERWLNIWAGKNSEGNCAKT